MIKVKKPRKIPKSLKSTGAAQTRKDCAAYDACSSDYKKRGMKCRNSIYGSKQVKNMLLKAHHYKCCYCERKFCAPRELAVEHFRPKSGVKQARNQKEQYPGYYWLAYKWDNLLLSCHECNSSYKQTLFPLANPSMRARSHNQDFRVEKPLFINPALQEPRDHIQFHNEVPVPLTKIGRVTIEGLGLDRRPLLTGSRLDKLSLIRRHRELLELAKKHPTDLDWQSVAAEATAYLQSAIRPESEYSSMAIDYLNKWPI